MPASDPSPATWLPCDPNSVLNLSGPPFPPGHGWVFESPCPVRRGAVRTGTRKPLVRVRDGCGSSPLLWCGAQNPCQAPAHPPGEEGLSRKRFSGPERPAVAPSWQGLVPSLHHCLPGFLTQASRSGPSSLLCGSRAL